MEVIEPDGETSGGPSTRSHEPLAENNGYVQIKSGTISVIPLNFQKKKKKISFCFEIPPVAQGPFGEFLTSPFAKRLSQATEKKKQTSY